MTRGTRLLLATLLPLCRLKAQEPVITSVTNAASYYKPTEQGLGVAAGSIIAIFGNHLSAETAGADGFPLPTKLGGTSVSIGGVDAVLFYVSPAQINAMVPAVFTIKTFEKDDFRALPVVVQSGSLASSPYTLRVTQYGLGMFTLDASGCGQALAYQRDQDGTVSLNNVENSADPGKTVITVLGTGAGWAQTVRAGPPPPDGEPAPPEGLPTAFGPLAFLAEADRWYAFLQFELTPRPEQDDPERSAGRAPGLVGVDQMTFTVPVNAPEGCAVPIRMVSTHYQSQNATISIHRGGGRCVDPSVESIGLLTWERTVTSGPEPDSVASELRVEFLAASGKKLPTRDVLPQILDMAPRWVGLEGPSCPLPSDTRLDAGPITAQGPDWGPVTARPDASNVYHIPLPPDAIHQGTFVVKGSGGRDVGAFETSVSIPSPIQPSSYPAGTRVPCCGVYGWPHFTWTGGDDASWVRVGMYTPIAPPVKVAQGDWLQERDALASKGQAGFGVTKYSGLPESANAELTITQDAVTPVTFSAPGLTQGGLHRWVYRWRFTGLVVNGDKIH
ncbi:MAG: hypothetical protein IT167_03565 [Bryobacterales bacterium]|nr:hypothetical protein [Bryobacterales bacterium]